MIARMQKTVSIAYATNATTGETDVNINGVVMGYAIVVPQLDGTTTVTFSLVDHDDYVLYSKAAIAENATTVVMTDGTVAADGAIRWLRVPVCGTMTLKVVTSGDQSHDFNFTVTIYYEEK